MNTLPQTAPQASIPSLPGGLLRWIGAGALAAAAYWERRAAVRTLLDRDDRELRDIGLLRSQIEAAVGGAFNPHMGRMRKPL